MLNYISVTEASRSWGISQRRIQKLCGDNRIKGAFKFGRSWMIPANTEKPNDARKICKEDCSDKRMEMKLYGNEIRKLSENEECTVYFVENKTGTGIVTYYNVFAGIEVYYNDFHMSDGFTKKKAQNTDIMEINHCRQGRFECTFKAGGYAYLGEGDLAINMLTNPSDRAYFPLSHYHGISIVIDIPKATETLNNLFSIFGNAQMNIKLIREKIVDNKGYFVMRATESIDHIFSELYNVPNEIKEGYIKIKIIELLMFLSTINIDNQVKERQYFSKQQVDKIKEMRKFLVEHLETRFTLVQLSDKFSVPLTSMKNTFKGIYGTPILRYMREYRLQAAAEMLRTKDWNISQISESVGYENPAKFSEAFQKLMKISPSDYRKKCCPTRDKFDLQD